VLDFSICRQEFHKIVVFNYKNQSTAQKSETFMMIIILTETQGKCAKSGDKKFEVAINVE
jgi:hypothetical protein